MGGSPRCVDVAAWTSVVAEEADAVAGDESTTKLHRVGSQIRRISLREHIEHLRGVLGVAHTM